MRHRVKVINCFEIPRNFLLSGLDYLFFLTIDDLLHLSCFLHHGIQPIDAGDVGAKIEAQHRIDAQESRNRDGMLVINQKRMLLRWAAVRHNVDLRARHGGLDA